VTLNTARVPAEAGADDNEAEDETNNQRDGIAGVKGGGTLGLDKETEKGKTKGLGDEGRLLRHYSIQKKTGRLRIGVFRSPKVSWEIQCDSMESFTKDERIPRKMSPSQIQNGAS